MSKIAYGMELKQEEHASQRPVSNRGAQNTEAGITSLIDWVEITFPSCLSVEYLCENFFKVKPDDLKKLNGGLSFYQTRYTAEGIFFLTDGVNRLENVDMGTHVILSGQACRGLEERFKLNDKRWRAWLASVIDMGGHFTRFDGAIDERKGIIDLEVVEEYVADGLLRTKFHSARVIKRYNLRGKEGQMIDGLSRDGGKTVYFGSPSSRLSIRMYDKAKEQQVDGHWVRVELQARDENADELARKLAYGVAAGECFLGVLRNYVNFIEENPNDSNRARWGLAFWWEEFLLGVERMQLTTAKEDKTFADKFNWFARQYAPTLAMVQMFFDRFGEYQFEKVLDHLLEQGRHKMSDKQKRLAMAG